MKNIKRIAVILLLTLVSMAFTKKEIVKTKTYYYFVYATTGVNADVYDKVWITPVKKITINEDKYNNIEKYGLANQFREYMEAEYRFSTSDVLNTEGDVYDIEVFDEATATKYYRETLKRFNSIVKIHDFRFIAEKK